LESKKTWEEEKMWCPGIGKGEIHTREEIDEEINKRVCHPAAIYEEIFQHLAKK
jgi:hypothetical protein